MKKLLSFLLCMIFVFNSFVIYTNAIPLSKGRKHLRNEFLDGYYDGSDYVYFSPVKDKNDDTKYPLMIWLHGKNSGITPRYQIGDYGFFNWASDEYQARFKNAGGCFLLAPRATASPINSWDATLCGFLKDIIDDYISKNAKNIDTSRIYISGYSVGANMVWNMLDAYPDFFAAALPLAAISQPVTTTLNKIKGTSVWIFASDKDYYTLGRSSVAKPVFNYLRKHSIKEDSVRMTTLSEAVLANGMKKIVDGKVYIKAEHFIWECATYDMFMNDGVTPYKYATTVDSNNKKISFTPGHALIEWLSEQTLVKPADGKMLLSKIIDFFYKIIKSVKILFS